MNLSLKRKSQIQMGETVAVVIIVIILIIIGIVFWNKVSAKDTVDSVKQSEELSAVEISKMLTELPELKCSSQNVQKPDCVDWYKVLAFNASMNGSLTHDELFNYYANFFKKSKISIKKIYPKSEEVTVVIYDNNISHNSQMKFLPMPIVIEDSVNNTRNFGIMIVEGYFN